jgi:murein L,D-transpeptidase YafK
LLAFKTERTVEVWGANTKGRYHWLGTFPVMAASGTAGPKHYEGDRQVPEGFYHLSELNPLSRFHLSMRVDYPNTEDIAASPLPRSRMGGDIFIHGNCVSAGCLAMGDPAIEKLFTLVALSQPHERRILIAPVDFRKVKDFPATQEDRVAVLYRRLRVALSAYR